MAAPFFPHEIIRDGQAQLLDDITAAFAAQKILLAHAPTGLGKTAGALAVAVQYALEQKKKIFFLTNRHTQHRIAIETLKLIREKTGQEIRCADLIGKRWMCNHDVAGLYGTEFNEYCKAVVEKGECEFYNLVRSKKGVTVEGRKALADLQHKGPLHNEELISWGRELGMCSYELSLALAKEAQIIIGDYYYIFNPHVQSTLFNKLELSLADVILIVDEGHNLPARVTEMVSGALTTNMIKNALIEAKKFSYGGIILWLQEIMRILTAMAAFPTAEKEKVVTREWFRNEVQKVVDYEELLNQLNMAADEVRKKQRKSYLGGMAAFLDSWQGTEDGFIRFLSEHESKFGPVIALHYHCVDPAYLTKPIFNQIFAGIVMSGTLKPMFMYRDLLGIERGIEKEYTSPFPAENKLTLVVPETSTKYQLRGEVMYAKIARFCSDFVQLIPGNVALFFPSYQVRDRISLYIQSQKEKFWEKAEMAKEEKEDLLHKFKAAKNRGAILLGVTGANFAEGIDFPGDLLNGVVVIGLPLARPDLPTRESIAYYEKKFGKGWDYGYVYPAINKCLQSAGRCIRSETDKGVIIYLDERFAWQNYFCCFPKEGLIVSTNYQKLVQEFFQRG